jgi:ABC-2 type transport system permease protein
MFNLEKTTDLLSFIEVNSFSKHRLLFYKSLTLLLINSIVYFVLYILTVLFTAMMGVKWQSDNLTSLFFLLVIQLFFSYTLIIFFLFIALKARDIKQATVISLSAWILLFFILPRLGVNISNNLYVLPSNLAFKDDIRKDIEDGLDGHGRGDKRQRALIDSVLKANQVDSTYKLPVNIDGIMLLKGEEYSAQVHNKHFSALKSMVQKQQRMSEIISLFSPYLLVKNLSMSICKTDVQSEISFKEQAESYRYYFVQELNKNMMLKSKENEFDTYKIQKSDFLSIRDFQYVELDLLSTLKNKLLELVLIVLTLTAVLVLIKSDGKNV